MTRLIPTDTELASYRMTVTLDGSDYVLDFEWSQREACWYISVLDQNETPIATGIKIVVEWDLLRLCVHDARPPGKLVAHDTSGQGIDAGFDELGTRVELLYFEAADVADVAALATDPGDSAQAL